VLAAAIAALAAAALAAPAGAALGAVGPVNPRTGFPDWYQDAGGLKLQACLDGLPLCSAAAGDLTPPDGEAFYWRAQGDLTSGSLNAKLALAREAAFLGGGITFDRVRATIVGGQPNTTYTVRHPYGTMSITTDGGGIGKSTTDVGCGASPCDWAAALGGSLGPFLHWDPTVAPAPAPGYIGDAATPHRVVGSPTGFNGFSVTGGGVALGTDLLTVEGKLADRRFPTSTSRGRPTSARRRRARRCSARSPSRTSACRTRPGSRTSCSARSASPARRRRPSRSWATAAAAARSRPASPAS
jgi:hypothetical protein